MANKNSKRRAKLARKARAAKRWLSREGLSLYKNTIHGK